MSSVFVHIGVRATDLEASLRFWRDALGLQVVETTTGCCDLSDGRHNVRVFQHTGAERPSHVSGLLDYLHVGIQVQDLAATARRCLDLGFPIIWEGVNAGRPYAGQELPAGSYKVTDPDGIVVDVTANTEQWPGVRL